MICRLRRRIPERCAELGRLAFSTLKTTFASWSSYRRRPPVSSERSPDHEPISRSRFTRRGTEKMRAQNTKNGAGDNQFGVRLGDLRKLAKKIKTNHELAVALWEAGNIDARLLATLLIKPKPSRQG